MKRFYFVAAGRHPLDEKNYPFLIKIDRESVLSEEEQIASKRGRHYAGNPFPPVEGKDYDPMEVVELAS